MTAATSTMCDLTNLGMNSQKSLKDHVTPYKVALLVLVEEYCKSIGEARDGQESMVLSEQEERELMIGLLHLVQSADLELRELLNKLEDVAKDPLRQSVMGRLHELTEAGVGALMDLFQQLQETMFDESTTTQLASKRALFSAPLLHRNSVLGLFVRRMQLAFDKLSFNQVTKLYNKYKIFHSTWTRYRQEQDLLERGHLADMSISIMEIAGKLDFEDPVKKHFGLIESGKYSQRQAEFFIAKQSSLLQHNELEAMSPKKLQQRIMDLLQSNPDLAEAHYLSYMNNLRINEYCLAMDSLYHYYDRQQSGGGSKFTNLTKAKQDEDTFNKGLRYAALNLAAMHYKFGHRLEALAAVKEAITIAQECNDHICLQHALSWLHRLGVQGTGNVAYMQDRLVTKTTEMNLPYLTSLGVQSSAKHIALAAAQPSKVFEFLLRSDIVNCQHSQSDLMAVSYAQKSALWQLYGKREMCSMNSQLLLLLNTSDQGVFHNSEGECIALCQLVRLHVEQGEYNSALEILGSTKRRFPDSSEHSQIWKLCEQQFLFTRAVFKGSWNDAEKAVDNMMSISSLEANYSQCVVLKEKGEASSAFELVQSLVDKCQDKKDQYQEVPELYARLLLLQGDLYCSTGNPSSAAQPLLTCITLCREHHFSYTVAMATLHLAFVQLSLGMPHQALTLIDGVLCLVLTHGTLYDQARAHFLQVKCQVAAASKVGSKVKRQAILSSVQVLNQVIESFEKVEAHHRTKAAVYYQARLYHELGCFPERNKVAHRLVELDQKYPVFCSASVNVF